MKIKHLLLAILCGMAGSMAWADGVPLSLKSTGNQLTLNTDASGVTTITTTGTDPYVFTNALSAAVPTDSCVLAFDYECAQGIDDLQLFYATTTGAVSELRSQHYGAIGKASTWMPYRQRIKNERTKFGWGAAGEQLRLDLGTASGVTLKIKNLRLTHMTDAERQLQDADDSLANLKYAKAEHLQSYLWATTYASQITRVEVGTDQVTITGHYAGSGEHALVDITPSEDVTETRAFRYRQALTGTDFTATVPRYASNDGYTYDRLLSKWAIVERNGSRDSVVSYARYADAAPALSSPAQLKPANKKGVGAGLGDTYMQDLVDLDAKNITCNWVITGMIAQNKIFSSNIAYSYGGHTYYIDGGQVAEWDKMLSFYEQHGISVSAIILITPNAADGSLSSVFRHPECDGGNYSMPNMTTMQSVNAYAAILSYLASRYNGSGHGRVEHWIMHNEVDMGTTWTNMGDQPELTYLDTYVKSMRLCYNLVRQWDQHASVLGSYTHSWTYGGQYSTKNMLTQTNRYAQLEGDFWWGVAAHPYPQDLTKSDFWVNDTQSTLDSTTKYVTFKNLEVINDWILAPEHLYQGSVKRNLFLSENGTNSPSYSDTDLAHQAAGGAWAWKKAAALPGIDAIMWHNWMDNRVEYGLRIGLHYFPDYDQNPGGRKPVWHLWQSAGTESEDSVFAPYMKILGIKSWQDIFFLRPSTSRTLQAGNTHTIEAEAYDQASTRLTTVSKASYSGSVALADMGGDWSTYALGQWADATRHTITPVMAQQNWGAWATYSVTAAEDLTVKLYVRHGAAWNQWGKAAALGCPPADTTYRIEGQPSLNWPKRYCGALVLQVDGQNVPTQQRSRPVAPDEYQLRGLNFNKIRTDMSKWTSTLPAGAAATDTLWTWPIGGGNNSANAYYSDSADYVLHLPRGKHVLRVNSLCSPWNFDCLRLDCYEPEAASGDINGDGLINAGDVTALVTLIINGTYATRGDIDANGTLNVADVTTLVTRLLTTN